MPDFLLHQRVGHIAVSYKHYVLVWGGLMRDCAESETYHKTDEVWFYNCATEVWTRGISKGNLPYRNSGATAVVCDDYLYIYGGVEEYSDEWLYSNDLHRLNLKTLMWSTLKPTGTAPQGCDKGVGWAYNGKLYFFGGYGRRSLNFDMDYSFDTDSGSLLDVRGWHNQLTVYDPVSHSWSIPKTKGQPPRPRATHAADLNGDKVYIFGGRSSVGRLNDFYCLDLKTMTWKEVKHKPGIPEIPEGRSWHSFNFISENHAILYGGLNSQGFPCTDWWECIIDGKEVSWILRGLMGALVWHKAAFSSITKELIIVGGVTCSPYTMHTQNHVENLLIVPFSPISLTRLCLQKVVKEKLWKKSDLPKCLLEIAEARTVIGSSKMEAV